MRAHTAARKSVTYVRDKNNNAVETEVFICEVRLTLDDPLDRQRLLIEVNKTSRGGGLRRQLDRYLQVKTKEWMAGLYYPGKS